MNILLHDYAGHPFQADLSRELARRGHQVHHLYFAGDPGPKGALSRTESDPLGLSFIGINITREYKKSSYISRRFGDVSYGRAVAEYIEKWRPDLVISGNTPTEAQHRIISTCRRRSVNFVYWVQDFYSVAVDRILRSKLGSLGALIGGYYKFLDRKHLRESDGIVVITEDFCELAQKWGGQKDKVTVIENWGSIKNISPAPKDNKWSAENIGIDKPVFLYSGTLALKHNPELLIRLARSFEDRACVVVVGNGVGVDHLKQEKQRGGLDNLKIFDLQPFNMLELVLASGDVLLSVIESDAGTFSVPSKVLSYLCASRPVLLAAPKDNLATRIVAREQAGLTVAPEDVDGFLAAAEKLYRDADLRRQMGANGRSYAEKTFDVALVADRFERVFAEVRNPPVKQQPKVIPKEFAGVRGAPAN